jgi:glycosyltransferase involved in cell wall biosynthesis
VKVSILVPTLGRSQALGRLVQSIRATTPAGRYEIVFVVDPDDDATKEALDHLLLISAALVVDESGTYPHKTNVGYREAEGELILPTADDVVFYPKWYEKVVQEFTEDDEVCVVGTNDRSPATEDGSHSTMPVVRRSYIEDAGAVLGETGTVFNEGYHHNFCETELWQLAWYRGVARFRSDAIIEHLHPDWGKRPLDATDEKGNRGSLDEDAALFYERAAAWT